MYVEDEPTELDRFRNTAYIMGTGQVKTIKNKENPPFCINLDKNIIQTIFLTFSLYFAEILNNNSS